MPMRKLKAMRTDTRYADKVHYMNPDGTGSMCNGLSMDKQLRDGNVVPNAYEVPDKYTTNCVACLKALEMLVRTEMNGLSADGLEKVHTLVIDLRLNGALNGLRDNLLASR
jgi:hypothetical protein